MKRTLLTIFLLTWTLALITCALVHYHYSSTDPVIYYHTLIICPIALTLILIVGLKSL